MRLSNLTTNFVLHIKLTTTSIPWAVRLSWLENAYSCPLFRRAILTRKASQTDQFLLCDQGLLIDLHTRLQVSVCSGYDLCHSG